MGGVLCHATWRATHFPRNRSYQCLYAEPWRIPLPDLVRENPRTIVGGDQCGIAVNLRIWQSHAGVDLISKIGEDYIMNTEIDDYQEFHHFQQLQAQYEEWLDSDDCVDYVNGLIQEILNDERECDVSNIA